MDKFDFIVVGGGPGGYPLAIRMAKQGLKVALVDKSQELGGTCLNRGCIPTKALLACAKGYHFFKNAKDFGLSAENISFNWQKIQERKDNITLKLRNGIVQLLKKAGVTVFNGLAKLFKNKRVVVELENEKKEITADKICICTGSIPFIPPVFPQNKEIFWSSDEALQAKEIPQSLLIVGGGVIGMELGQVFNEFGCKVTVVEMLPHILSGFDSSTTKRLMPVFKKAGLKILTGKKVESLKEKNGKAVAVIGDTEETYDKVLIAIGRRVNQSFMQDTDLELITDKGKITVNEQYETSEPGIYAVGDAIHGPMLAHKASYDAYVLSEQLKGNKIVPDYSIIPGCVFTYPEIAWVGKTEDTLKKENVSYKVGRSMFSANGKALTAGEGEGQTKVFIDENNKILGAIIWGANASNLLSEATLMAKLGIDAKELLNVVHPHPTLSEIYFEAVESVVGTSAH